MSCDVKEIIRNYEFADVAYENVKKNMHSMLVDLGYIADTVEVFDIEVDPTYLEIHVDEEMGVYHIHPDDFNRYVDNGCKLDFELQ